MKRIVVLTVVLAALAGVVVLKKGRATVQPPARSGGHAEGLPRLLDLGSKGCAACKMLEPVLEELRTTQAGKLQVDFIDVWQNEGVAEQYGIQIIPVQIFYDANGRELGRHEGYLSAGDVVAKFAELGVPLDAR